MPKAEIFQLKITLQHSQPSIWRRILVKSDTNMDDLHHVLQVVMGWDDDHLHHFFDKKNYYCPPPEFGQRQRGIIYTKLRIAQLLPFEKSKIFYEYDFGDSWKLEILLEKRTAKKANQKYPYCLTGERAAPPEDLSLIHI